MINFNVSEPDRRLIEDIAARALVISKRAGVEQSRMDWEMDLTACHMNGSALRLADLRGADDFNFTHDVFGIRRHLDRSTGRLKDCFVPRYAVRQ